MTVKRRPLDATNLPPRTVIGWREYVSIPEWDVSFLKAKIDTGARTSAIDVDNVQELSDDQVRFDLVLSRKTDEARRVVEAKVIRRTRVRSSFGASHDRLVVAARIRLGSVEKVIELSLVSRHNMLCRMLLGRKALEPEFLIDCGHRYLLGRKPRRRISSSRGKQT